MNILLHTATRNESAAYIYTCDSRFYYFTLFIRLNFDATATHITSHSQNEYC